MSAIIISRLRVLAAGALLALAAFACASPAPTATLAPTPAPTFTPTPAATATPTPTPAGPCEGKVVDCSPRDVSGISVVSSVASGGAAFEFEIETPTLEDVLEKGYLTTERSPVHVAARGTTQPWSFRCDWSGLARTAGQREDAIRFWLAIDEDTTLPSDAELRRRFMTYVNNMSEAFRPTWTANISAMVDGGLNTDYVFLICYANYRVNEYVLGAGPVNLTVAYETGNQAPSYDLYSRAHAAGALGDEAKISEAELMALRDELADEAAAQLERTVSNREVVVFLAPLGANATIAVEAWQVVEQWELQTKTTEAGAKSVVAVRYGVPADDSEYSLPYADLKRRVTAAAGTDSFAGKRIANVSGLTQYYRDIGAYGDITPGDGKTTTFTPAGTPPHCGGAVGTTANSGLVRDCFALMDAKDTLRGTASLNWDFGRAIGTWDGVTVSGTPQRVTGLDLPAKKLTGTVPSSLGKLSQLTRLYLQDNKLTGSIPQELGGLSNLTRLNLYHNSLSGSIPPELGDLSELRLFYLNNNKLTGSIPTELGDLSKVWHFNLNNNSLSGSIPSSLGRLSRATNIQLAGNGLTGGVPSWLGNLTRLEWLYLGDNKLTGSIPSQLGNLARLLRLGLQDNKLTGSIPSSLGGLSRLTHVYLSGNSLTGCVPAALRRVSTNDLSAVALSDC